MDNWRTPGNPFSLRLIELTVALCTGIARSTSIYYFIGAIICSVKRILFGQSRNVTWWLTLVKLKEKKLTFSYEKPISVPEHRTLAYARVFVCERVGVCVECRRQFVPIWHLSRVPWVYVSRRSGKINGEKHTIIIINLFCTRPR